MESAAGTAPPSPPPPVPPPPPTRSQGGLRLRRSSLPGYPPPPPPPPGHTSPHPLPPPSSAAAVGTTRVRTLTPLGREAPSGQPCLRQQRQSSAAQRPRADVAPVQSTDPAAVTRWSSVKPPARTRGVQGGPPTSGPIPDHALNRVAPRGRGAPHPSSILTRSPPRPAGTARHPHPDDPRRGSDPSPEGHGDPERSPTPDLVPPARADEAAPRPASPDAPPLLAKAKLDAIAATLTRRPPPPGIYTRATLNALLALLAATPPPVDLVLCEFSGAVAARIAASGRTVLACDSSPPERVPGLFYQGDLRDIVGAYDFDRCIAHPPCEHQTISASRFMQDKALDGRLFWGSAFVLFCHCVGRVNLTEQPRTFWNIFYPARAQVVQPYHFGDDRKKTTNFFLRGTDASIPWTNNLGAGDSSWRHARHGSANEGYRFRSKLLPGMAAAIADHLPAGGTEPPPTYLDEVEALARRFFAAGLPVPYDYRNPDARPTAQLDRDYQQQRGFSPDGRTVSNAVTPVSLRTPDEHDVPSAHHVWTRQAGTAYRPLSAHETPVLPSVLKKAATKWACIRASGLPPPPSPAASEASHVGSEDNEDLPSPPSSPPAAARAPRQRGHAATTSTPGGGAALPAILLATAPTQTTAVFPIALRRGKPHLALVPTPFRGDRPACFGSVAPWPQSNPGVQRKWQAAEGARVARLLVGAARDTHCFLAASPRKGDAGSIAVVALAVRTPEDVFPDRVRGAGGLAAHPGPAAWCPIPAIPAAHTRQLAQAALLTLLCLAQPALRPPLADSTRPAMGIGEPTQLGGRLPAAPPPLDQQRRHARIAAALASFEELACARAAKDSIAAPMLYMWCERVQRTSVEYQVPPELTAELYEPGWHQLADLPFSHRCAIPSTSRLPRREALETPSTPPAADCWECVEPAAAREMLEHWDKLEAWHRRPTQTRPSARAWSVTAIREPWRTPILKGWTLDFRQGRGEWLHPDELARPSIISREVAARYFHNYPHQRLVGMLLDGASYQAPLPPAIVLSHNLYSMYATAGGIDAVVDEVAKHVERRFRCRAPHRCLPTLPFRSDPIGCAERKDDPLRPRVLCDSGAPRKPLLTSDTAEPVPARNDAARPMRHDPADPNPKWFTEQKPTLEDAARSCAILAYIADALDETPLTFSFDFKYFFHQLVLAAHELWASGSLVPERAAVAGAPDTLIAIITSVMAMGVAPASNIAQDLGNAIMWRLLSYVDAALRPYVAAQRKKRPLFDTIWARRLRLPEDSYGTQARLVDGLQYTDDALPQAACAAAGVELLVQFAHIIGPPHFWEGCAFDAKPLATHVARNLARASSAASVPRLHGLNLEAAKPDKLFGGQAAPWVGGVVSAAWGALWVTRAKLLRTYDNATLLLEGRMCVSAYRSFIGFITSLNALRRVRKYDLKGLHEPLRAAHEHGRGPTTLVACGGEGRHNFRKRWLAVSQRILDTPGVSVLVACGLHTPLAAPPPPCRWEVSLDASGDDAPSPGLGTFLYGRWQHLAVASDPRLGQLQIPHHEALAAGLGLVFAAEHLVGVPALDLVTDALASYLGLGAGALSPVIIAIHESILEMPEYRELSGKGILRIVHRWGELNVGADYASRLLTDDLSALCRALHLDERRCDISPRQHAWLDGALNRACAALDSRACDPAEPGGTAYRHASSRSGQPPLRIPPPFASRPPATSAHLQNATFECTSDRCTSDRGISDGCTSDGRPHQMCALQMGGPTDVCTSDGRPHQMCALQMGGPTNVCTSDGRPHQMCALQMGSPTDVCTSDGRPHQMCALQMGGPTDVCTLERGASSRSGRPPLHIPPPFASRPPATSTARHTGVPVPPRARPVHEIAAPLPLANARPAGRYAALRARSTGTRERAPVAPEPLVTLPPRTRPRSAPYACKPDVAATRRLAPATLAPDLAVQPSPKPAVLRPTPTSLGRAGTLNRALLGDHHRDDDYVAEVTASILTDSSSLAVRPPDIGAYTTLVAAGTRAIAARFADGTNKNDKCHWGKWAAYCRHVCGTPPLRADQAANTDPGNPMHVRELNLALGCFLHWCLTEPQYKPASHMARLRGVVRYHRRASIRFVDLSFVTSACKGIIRLLVKAHGPEVVAVRRKEPLQPWMLERWLALPHGTRIGPYVVGNNLPWLGVRVFITLEATSGFRKDDIALNPGVVFGMSDLSLRFVHYRFAGVFYETPTLELLLAADIYTYVLITPPPSKADFDGSRWGASPICSRWHPTAPINLARELVRYEIARRLFTPQARKLAPLLLNERGLCWRKPALTEFFKLLLLQIMPAAMAAKYTIHSFRIYLACALRDQGVPPDAIKEILRWASNEALALYARANVEADAATRASAAAANVDSVRTTSIPGLSGLGAPSAADLARTLAGAPARPSAFHGDVNHTRREAMVSGALARRSIDIDTSRPEVDADLDVFANIHASSAALQRQADLSTAADDHSGDEDD